MTQSTDTLTKVLAFWGAILSSIGFGWTLYRDTHDRAKFKAEASIRRIARATDGRFYSVKPSLEVEASEELFVIMDVTNVGRRPLLWQGWGGKYIQPMNGKDGFAIIPTHIPKMLRENETHSEWSPAIVTELDNIRELFVWDATGKYWYISKKCLKILKADARRYGAAA